MVRAWLKGRATSRLHQRIASEGIFQVNFQIAADAPSGDPPLMIQIGDKVTQTGVTVTVK